MTTRGENIAEGGPGAKVEAAMTPDQLATAIETTADPYATIEQLALAAGLNTSQATALAQRLRVNKLPVVQALRKVKTRELLDAIDDRAAAALEFLTDAKLAEASAKDTAIVLGILLEKRQLLRGEPTQILAYDERRKLNDLVPELIAEAKRRGMSIELRGPLVDVTPADPELEDRGGHDGKSRRKKDHDMHTVKVAKEAIGEPD